MSLKTLPTTDIIIDLPNNIVIGAITYKRKITVQSLVFNPAGKTVSSSGTMKFYNLDDSPVPDSNLVRSYPVSMVADNNTYVDLTGKIICTTMQLMQEQQMINMATMNGTSFTPVYTPLLNSEDYMHQFDYFFQMAENTPIVLNALITQFFLQNIQLGRFD